MADHDWIPTETWFVCRYCGKPAPAPHAAASDAGLCPAQPCGSEDCDKCDPRPRWRITEHRIQHLTYEREIKAATAEEAMEIFHKGTAWPSSYDDRHGEVIQQDAPVIKQITSENEEDAFHLEYYRKECCWHDLPSSKAFTETPGDLAADVPQVASPLDAPIDLDAQAIERVLELIRNPPPASEALRRLLREAAESSK